MIVMQNVTKTYNGGVTALRGVTLDIGTGMFGLLGPNGAGKTTLMRILSGLLRASGGSVMVDGQDINTPHGKQIVKASLGYLPQELGLYPEMTGREFLDYMGILKGITDRRARQAQVEELLELVRLGDVGNRRLKTYSGGMKRRVGIAQTMLGNPRLLIVDEPTVGLDPEERVRIRNLLSDLSQRCTVLLSTHVIEDIGHSCNDLAIINKGGVLFRGTPAQLIEQARGKVWSVTTAGDYPEGMTVVSTLQLREGIQYRVIGTPPTHVPATPLEPGLEDGYMLRMRESA